jgi:hypothetical protein
MPHRAAKFASAVIASLLASIPLATISHGETPAAGDCLSGPKGQTPQGSHWHYRIEHPSNRHCWYLRGENDAATQIAPTNSSANAANASASDNSISPTTAMPGSIANAHAELPSPQTRGDQDTSAAAGQLPAADASLDSAPHANLPDTNMLRSVVASRWPEQLASASSAVSDTSPDNSAADAASPAAATQPSTQPSAAPVVPLAAVDAAPEKQSGSTQMLIIAIVGALSVAGLAASAVGYGGRRKSRVGEIQLESNGDRRAIWETTLTDRPLPSPFPAPAALRPNIGIPRELREADDADDKIAEMLVRLARSAQS